MKGVQIGRGSLEFSHLFFADHYILFGDALEEGAQIVRRIILKYESISSQNVNFDKSLIYFGANVSSNIRDQVESIWGVRVSSNPKKYSGYQ